MNSAERLEMPLSGLLERYRAQITPRKRWARTESGMIAALLKEPFADKALADLSPRDFAEYRDRRAKSVKGSTLIHDLNLLSHVFKIAKSEWDIPISNPIQGLERPAPEPPRDRRLRGGELDRMRAAAQVCRNKHVWPCVLFALATAMRRGEILALQWPHINWSASTLYIPHTKTGKPREIPLSRDAVSILRSQLSKDVSRPFPLSAEALRQSWERLMTRAGIDGLHFHDLRHEAISRFFELGLSIPEVATISGHKDPRMLFRYTHLRAADIVGKLDRLCFPSNIGPS